MTGIRSWTLRLQRWASWSESSRSPPRCHWRYPANPNSCEREHLAFADFETVRLLRFPDPLPLVVRLRRNQAPAGFQCTRNAGFVHAVSDLALIIFVATDESLAHDRMSPSEQTTVLGQVPSDLAG